MPALNLGCALRRDKGPIIIQLSSAQTTLRTRGLLAAAAALALSLSVANPAAASAVGTPATLTVEGGVLAISMPSETAKLGTVLDTVAGSTISGSLGQVVVSDARKTAAGGSWTASVISTAFTPDATPATAIAASAVGYSAGAITKVGTATHTAQDSDDLTADTEAVKATGITGNNSATWSPTIWVDVPGGAVNGVYTATVTHSVL